MTKTASLETRKPNPNRHRQERIKLMNSLMVLAKEIGAWVVTLGLDVGLSKCVGEAKRNCDAHGVPLIGLCPWGLVEGRQALWEEEADRRVLPMTEMHVHENFGDHEKQFRFRKERDIKSASLDRNHTHFILVDDETEGMFGGETACRMAFEMSVQVSIFVTRCRHLQSSYFLS